MERQKLRSGGGDAALLRYLETAAREQHVRVVCVAIDDESFVVLVPGEPGAQLIDGRDPDLYDRLDADADLDDPRAREQWTVHGRSAARGGVEARTAGHLEAAYVRQRLAMYVAARVGTTAGVKATVANVWIIREQVRDVIERALGPHASARDTEDGQRELEALETGLRWTLATIRRDAAALCEPIEAMADDAADDLVASLVVRHALHRVALMAGRDDVRRRALARLVQDAAAHGNEQLPLIAAADELAQMDVTAALAAIGVLAPDHDEAGLSRAWGLYLEHRASAGAIVDTDALYNALRIAFRHIAFLRLRATAGGGAFGHQLSYGLSVLLQAVGRDLTGALVRAGLDPHALLAAEQTLGRAMADWMGRTHGAWAIPREFTAAIAPVIGSVNAVPPAELDDIVAAAEAYDAPVLYYVALHDGFASWIVDPTGQMTPIELGDVETALQPVYALLPYVPARPRGSLPDTVPAPAARDRAEELDQALASLHEALIPPALDRLLSTLGERVVIVADAALNAVPFAALRTPRGRYLIEERELVFLPSITAWLGLEAGSRLRPWQRARRSGAIAPVVFGKRYFRDEYSVSSPDGVQRVRFGELPGAHEEAVAVANLLGVEPLLEDAVTADAVIGASGSDVLHIATHGYLDELHPGSSFLALDGGILLADGLYRHDPGVRAGLVVLSACRTGLGAEHPDSVIGLGNAFLIAGASSVITTLWRIPDDVTARMMIAFHRSLRDGADIAAALRSCQVATLRDAATSHPADWAAFRLTGRAANPYAA